MERKQIQNYLGYPEMLVVDAMKKIDITGNGILFIVGNANKLLGVLTDGDIRRWLINTGSLDVKVQDIMNKTPLFSEVGSKESAMEQVKKNKVRALPIVDKNHCVVDIIFNNADNEDIFEMSSVLEDVPVVIMAGGKGTRLLPYTQVIPKPLIPIGDKTILERIIDQFCKFGCKKFYLVLNYKKDLIRAYLKELDRKIDIEFIDEEIPLGTGGGLSLLKDKLVVPFVLSNCDILINEDFGNIMEFHKSTEKKISIIGSLKNYEIPYGVVHMGKNGGVKTIEEKPTLSFFVNTGCYIVNPEVLDTIPENKFVNFPDVVSTYLKEDNQVGIYPINASAWMDMGQMDELENMRRYFEG